MSQMKVMNELKKMSLESMAHCVAVPRDPESWGLSGGPPEELQRAAEVLADLICNAVMSAVLIKLKNQSDSSLPEMAFTTVYRRMVIAEHAHGVSLPDSILGQKSRSLVKAFIRDFFSEK